MWVRQMAVAWCTPAKAAGRAQSAPVRWVLRERGVAQRQAYSWWAASASARHQHHKKYRPGRLLNEDSTQPLRFHAGADDMLVSQLTAERQVRRGGNLVWETVSKTNHLLDCLMMSGACADASWTPSLPLCAAAAQAGAGRTCAGAAAPAPAGQASQTGKGKPGGKNVKS